MELKGEWTPSTAGGGIDQPSWRSNTQFILKGVQPGQTVTITLKLVDAEATDKDSVGFAIIGKGGEGFYTRSMFTNTNEIMYPLLL